jgi:8-amino-3,8-dideoxy-alpha-D-manno-octulosonate transaminase
MEWPMPRSNADRLALDDGIPVRAQPYETTRGLGLWGEEEVAAGLEVLRSRSLFRYYGPRTPARAEEFERRFAARTGTSQAVAVSSGTAALTCALVGLGIPEGAEVIVPAVTFIGCVNAVVWARGVPVFAEVDDSLTLAPSALAEVVTDRTFAVMPVHLGNVAADMDPIMDTAARHGLKVIEDAAQAAGVGFGGRPVGGIGDVGAFSFQLDKNITAGEGGALVTDREDVADRARRYQDQGGQFTNSRGAVRGRPGDEAFLGVNLRITELSAALLGVQLDRLDAMLERMREISRVVRAGLAHRPLCWRRVPDEAGSGGDLTLLLDSRLHARRFRSALVAEGIPAYTLYDGRPVYAHPSVRAGRTAWGHAWSRVNRCRSSEDLLGRSVTVGLGSRMTDQDVEDVIHALDKVAGAMTPG